MKSIEGLSLTLRIKGETLGSLGRSQLSKTHFLKAHTTSRAAAFQRHMKSLSSRRSPASAHV